MKTPAASQLRCYFNWLALDGLRTPASGWMRAIRDDGYDGVQFVEPVQPDLVQEARSIGLGVCGSGRVNQPSDAYRLAEEGRNARLECLTLHVGWGYEDQDEASRLIEAILEASKRYSIPLYVETHRATIFQDMWRTVQLIQQFPQLQFNGDFSHWYTGMEMVYGGFENKLAFIQPVIERIHFLHGRIGNPGCMQVDIGNLENAVKLSYVAHFRTLWTQVFLSFLRRSPRGENFCFAAELLAPNVYYARTFHGSEESDRWQQSLVLTEIARGCFDEAQKQLRHIRE
jgi:hypothetical protein